VLVQTCWSHPGTYLGEVGVSLVVPAPRHAPVGTAPTLHTLVLKAGAGSVGMTAVLDGEPLSVQGGDRALDLVHSRVVDASAFTEAQACRSTLEGGASAPLMEVDGALDTDLLSAADVASSAARTNVSSSCTRLLRKARYGVQLTSTHSAHVWTPTWSLRFDNSDLFFNQAAAFSGLDAVLRVVEQEEVSAEELHALPHGLIGQTWSTKRYNNQWRHIEGESRVVQ
jgi:hypothetical protein